MPQYQAKTVEVAPVDGETFVQTAVRVMNEQGQEGWSFTHYVPSESPGNSSHYYFFQRQIAEE